MAAIWRELIGVKAFFTRRYHADVRAAVSIKVSATVPRASGDEGSD